MSSTLLNKAGKQLFAKHIEHYTPQDPLYEYYDDGKGSKKQKRRKRALPPNLSSRDKEILISVRRRAHYLDKGFSILGFRFGWTFFLGLIPIFGDLLDAYLNYALVVRKARKADIPPWLLRRMLFNNAVSAGVGTVPFVGDVVLAAWKANSRNAALLEEFLRLRGQAAGQAEGVGTVAGASTGTGTMQATKLTPHDVEEVKPGAGMPGGSVIEARAMEAGAATVGHDHHASGSGFGSLFSRRKGKFVEHVSNTAESQKA
ncbi:hypothetical protein BD779DRAFT_1496155 [Infundibulicybe gibba]|nr:hypothetical protein BD779DRAFT_1496155 [Infundibulicybe gibba]